jgi:hypothetical protein
MGTDAEEEPKREARVWAGRTSKASPEARGLERNVGAVSTVREEVVLEVIRKALPALDPERNRAKWGCAVNWASVHAAFWHWRILRVDVVTVRLETVPLKTVGRENGMPRARRVGESAVAAGRVERR